MYNPEVAAGVATSVVKLDATPGVVPCAASAPATSATATATPAAAATGAIAIWSPVKEEVGPVPDLPLHTSPPLKAVFLIRLFRVILAALAALPARRKCYRSPTFLLERLK